MSGTRIAMLEILGDTLGDPVVIDTSRFRIGRDSRAELRLQSPYVSRFHTEIAQINGEYLIRDMGSKNGTLVNGAPIGEERVPLSSGDLLELGQGRFSATFTIASETVTLPSAAVPGPRIDVIPDRGVVVDELSRNVFVDGSAVEPPLSMRDFNVLSLLAERRGQACSHRDIAAVGWVDRVSGGHAVSSEEISQSIHRIRRVIGQTVISTVRGFGYRMEFDEEGGG